MENTKRLVALDVFEDCHYIWNCIIYCPWSASKMLIIKWKH